MDVGNLIGKLTNLLSTLFYYLPPVLAMSLLCDFQKKYPLRFLKSVITRFRGGERQAEKLKKLCSERQKLRENRGGGSMTL